MRIQHCVCIALVLATLSTVGKAQQASDIRATIALRSTHIGALAPMMTPAMINRRLNGAQFGVRYGLLDEGGVRTQAVVGAASFLMGLESSFTLDAGVLDADCFRCSPAMLLGAGADMRIANRGDFMGSGSQLSVSVSGEIGYGQLKPGSDYAIALGVGVPFALSFGGGGQDGLRFVPYF